MSATAAAATATSAAQATAAAPMVTLNAIWFLKCIFAFAFVIALMYLLSWGLRKLGVAGQGMLPGGRRRMKIVEYLALDHRRRLVLVRLDDSEHLIVLGPQGETVVQAGLLAPKEEQKPQEQKDAQAHAEK